MTPTLSSNDVSMHKHYRAKPSPLSIVFKVHFTVGSQYLMPRAKKKKKKILLVKAAEPLLCHHLPASSTGWQKPSGTLATKQHREVFVQRCSTGIKIKAERPGSPRSAPSPRRGSTAPSRGAIPGCGQGELTEERPLGANSPGPAEMQNLVAGS